MKNQTCPFHQFLEVSTLPMPHKNGVFSMHVRMIFTFISSGARCRIYGCSESQVGRTASSDWLLSEGVTDINGTANGCVNQMDRLVSCAGLFALTGTFYSPAKPQRVFCVSKSGGINLRNQQQRRGYSMMLLASLVECC